MHFLVFSISSALSVNGVGQPYLIGQKWNIGYCDDFSLNIHETAISLMVIRLLLAFHWATHTENVEDIWIFAAPLTVASGS